MLQTKKAPLWLRMLCALLSAGMILGMLFLCLSGIIRDEDFFYAEYDALQNAAAMGMSTQDLTDATMQMIYYMEGKADSIDLTVTVHGERVSMFNDRERAHMVDVRLLYQAWKWVSLGLLTVYVLFAAGLLMQKMPVTLLRGFLWGSGVFVVVLLLLGAWVLVDFNSFWNAFHHLFFSNDLWLLDPRTSRMINMMPLALFYRIAQRLLLRFGLLFVGSSAVAVWGLRRSKRIVKERD